MSSLQQPNARLRPFRPAPFGRYTLLAPLSTGGMGELYLARLEGAHGFEKLCVVKKILPSLVSDAEMLERFVTEAKTLARLSHGAIAQVLELSVQDAEPYLVLEYVDGKDLRRVAARARERNLPLPLTFILTVMVRVLDALAYVHRKRGEDERELGLVHRDVSPQNILVSYEGEVKVIDFGLAKSALNPGLTHPSIILGKFLYMSPEQARHEPVDRRSDLYSVGLCLYELIAGRNPFEGCPPAELMAQVSQPRIPSLHTVDPLLPGDVVALVARALAPEASGRFQTAEELRRAVLDCLNQMDPQAGTESVTRFMRDTFSAEYAAERKLLASLKEVRPKVLTEPPPDVETGVGPRAPLLKPAPIRPAPLSFAPTPRAKDAEPLPTEATVPGVYVDESRRETQAAVRMLSWEAPPGKLEVVPPRRAPVTSPAFASPIPTPEAGVPWTDLQDTTPGTLQLPSVVVGEVGMEPEPPTVATQPRVEVAALAQAHAAAQQLKTTEVEKAGGVGATTHPGTEPAPASRAWRIGAVAVLAVVALLAATGLAYKTVADADGEAPPQRVSPMEPVVRQPPSIAVAGNSTPREEPDDEPDALKPKPPLDGDGQPVVMPTVASPEEDEELPALTVDAKAPGAKKSKRKPKGRYATISANYERIQALLAGLRDRGHPCETLGTLCSRVERLGPDVAEAEENVDIHDRVLKNVRAVLAEVSQVHKANR